MPWPSSTAQLAIHWHKMMIFALHGKKNGSGRLANRMVIAGFSLQDWERFDSLGRLLVGWHQRKDSPRNAFLYPLRCRQIERSDPLTSTSVFHYSLLYLPPPEQRLWHPPRTGYFQVYLMALVLVLVMIVCSIGWAVVFFFCSWFGSSLPACSIVFWCQGTTPQWEGTHVKGWKVHA